MHRSKSKCKQSSAIKLVDLIPSVPSAPSEYALTINELQENYRNFEFNGKLYSSVWPERIELLSEKEQSELKEASWFHAGLKREVSLDILLQQPPGSFLIRQSESHPKCFALSMRVEPLEPPKLSHYLIEKTRHGFFKIKGFVKEFTTLSSLVVHHSVLKEQLPIPLALPRPADLLINNLIVYESEAVAADCEDDNENVTTPTTTLCCKRKDRRKVN